MLNHGVLTFIAKWEKKKECEVRKINGTIAEVLN